MKQGVFHLKKKNKVKVSQPVLEARKNLRKVMKKRSRFGTNKTAMNSKSAKRNSMKIMPKSWIGLRKKDKWPKEASKVKIQVQRKIRLRQIQVMGMKSRQNQTMEVRRRVRMIRS